MNLTLIPTERDLRRAFGEDHVRLRGLLGRTLLLCGPATVHEARALFGAFADALRSHIRAEDDVLFAAFFAAVLWAPRGGPSEPGGPGFLELRAGDS